VPGAAEVNYLMRLIRRGLLRAREDLHEHNIRLKVIGRVEELPEALQKDLREAVAGSARNTGLVVRLALNYGGRREILDAVRRIARDVKRGDLAPRAINEQRLRGYLYDPEMTDPDLLIRTGGEQRISNFLLWHLAYTELWLTPVCWPEFREAHLEEALKSYAARQRRFGAVPQSRRKAGRRGAAASRP